MNADRTLPTDARWALLAPLLPGRVGRRGVVAKANRGFAGAVLWVGRMGLPCRDLPPHRGQWHRVFGRFSRRRTRGVWAQVLADTAYDSDALRAQIAETGAVAVIPPCPNRLQPPCLDPLTYRDRSQVERLINRRKQFRCIATRYDKLADSHAAFVQLRAIARWLN